jgi:hypothetical protein
LSQEEMGCDCAGVEEGVPHVCLTWARWEELGYVLDEKEPVDLIYLSFYV